MSQTLREQLIGVWELVSQADSPVERAAHGFPLGDYPLGMLMYTADGYMSAQLMQRERAHFSQDDMYAGTLDEFAAQATSYLAYSGTFHVDEQNRTLTHTMALSLFPNWTGQAQARIARLEGDRLDLSGAAPISLGGKIVAPILRWKRAASKCL